MPRTNKEKGQNVFEKIKGPVQSHRAESVGDMDGLVYPNQFRSCQYPVRICGIRACCAHIPPYGPSFENMTSFGSKLRKNKIARTVASSAANTRNCFASCFIG